jgi:hypothetical protein
MTTVVLLVLRTILFFPLIYQNIYYFHFINIAEIN